MTAPVRGCLPKISYRSEPDTQDEARGYRVQTIFAYDGNQQVGYIRSFFLCPTLFKKNIPTVWHYQSAFKGWCLKLEDRPALWRKAHLYARCNPASNPELGYLSLQENNTPDVQTIEQDLNLLGKSYTAEMVKWLRLTANKPVVEFINVDERLRRQGIGTQLYKRMAKYLARLFNLPLYASTLQTAMAKAAWNKMFSSGKYPIRRVSRYGKRSYCFDYAK